MPVKTTVNKVHRQSTYASKHKYSQLWKGKSKVERTEVGEYVIYSHPQMSTATPFATVFHKDKPDTPIISVPTDAKGNIPKEIAILRLVETEGKPRSSVLVDLGIEAKTQAKNKAQTPQERLEQYLWYMRPNQSDLEKVDTTDAKWTPSKDGKRRGPVIVILGAKGNEANAIREMIDQSFTQREKKLMDNVVIEVKNGAGKGIAGFHQRARGPAEFNQIVVDRHWLQKDPDKAGPKKGDTKYDSVVVHELIHFLRHRDPKRVGTTAATPYKSGGDHDLEEAFTDAETIARTTTAPWGRRGDGYYRGKDALENITHDRQLLLNVRDGSEPKHDSGELNKSGRLVTVSGIDLGHAVTGTDIPEKDLQRMFDNQRGAAAVKSTDERFPDMKIAKTKIKGSKEAIDTYWKLKNGSQTYETHIYAPGGSPSVQDLHSIASPVDGKLTEFQDGREVPITGAPSGTKYAAARKRSAAAAGIAPGEDKTLLEAVEKYKAETEAKHSTGRKKKLKEDYVPMKKPKKRTTSKGRGGREMTAGRKG